MSGRAFPLQWPDGWKRTAIMARRRAPYKVTPERALDEMLHSLKLLGADKRTIIVSSNVPVRNDGMPYAIGLAVDGLRAMDRAGATQILERAFSAFAALPAASAAPVMRPWWEVFGVPQELLGALSLAMVEARYRELAAKAHPDQGGSQEAIVELNLAREQARAHFGGG